MCNFTLSIGQMENYLHSMLDSKMISDLSYVKVGKYHLDIISIVKVWVYFIFSFSLILYLFGSLHLYNMQNYRKDPCSYLLSNTTLSSCSFTRSNTFPDITIHDGFLHSKQFGHAILNQFP